MTAKRKVLSNSTRELARIAANLDGKGEGLSQRMVETAMKHIVTIEAACILSGYFSQMPIIRKLAKKKAEALKKKQRSLKVRHIKSESTK